MHHNCNHEHKLEAKNIDKSQMNILIFICLLNFSLFLLEFSYGMYAKSNSLISDCLDNFSDSIAYLVSLIALSKGNKFKTYAAIFKAVLILILALFVLYKIFNKLLYPSLPQFEIMTYIGIISFAINSICVFLLLPYKSKDINMYSVWLCSRNDAIANIFIIFTAILTWYFNSYIPDIAVAAILFILFFQSSISIFKLSYYSLKNTA